MKKHILYVSTTLPTPGLGSSVIIYRHLKRLKDWKVGYAPNHKKQKEIAEMLLKKEIGKEVFNDLQEPLRKEEEALKRDVKALELKLVEKEDSREYHNLLAMVMEKFTERKKSLTINEKKALLRLVFKEIVVTNGKLTRFELYEPFKTLLKEVDFECQTKEIKPTIRQKDAVCTYAHSDGRWYKWRRMVLAMIRAIHGEMI